MISYMIRRILQAVVVTLIVTIIVFGILHLLPGGLVRAQLGLKATSTQVLALTREEGLTRPLPVQYGIWLGNVLRGNLGFSYMLSQSVGSLLVEYVPRTLILAGTSVILSLLVALPLGLWQGARRNHLDDHGLTVVMMLFYSMPTFLLGVILIFALSIWEPLLPSTAANYGTGLITDVKDLALPVLTLSLANVSYFSRYLRSAVIDNILEDYVRTVRAKGLSDFRVLTRHVLRNSLASTVTLVGLSIPLVLSGAVVVEQLFDYPGVGLLFWNAAQGRDYPVLLGVVLMVTIATVIGNLLADLGYIALDPRLRT